MKREGFGQELNDKIWMDKFFGFNNIEFIIFIDIKYKVFSK